MSHQFSARNKSEKPPSLRQQWKGWQVKRCSCIIPALKWSILFLLFQFAICFSHPHSPAQWDLTPLCSRLSSGELNGWKEEGMMKCINFHFVQNRPKSNADRAHHTAASNRILACVKSIFSKRKGKTSSVIWLPYSSICFLKSQQHCWPNASQKVESCTIYLFLHTCLRFFSDTGSLVYVLRTWLTKPVWLAPASSNCQVWLPSPWWAPLKCRGPDKTPSIMKSL